MAIVNVSRLQDGHARRSSRARALVPLLLSAAVLFTSPALAQEGEAQEDPALSEGLEPSIAVIELYMSSSSFDKTPYYAVRIADELANIGGFAMLSRDDAERQLKTQLASSGRRVTDDKLAEIESMLKQGDELVYSNPRKAIEILDQAKAELQAIMESINLNQKLRQDFFTTQMLLARSHYDNGNKAKASEIMEEIIRVFGDEWKVTEEDYHPDIVALYRESYRRLSEARTGSIKVVTEPAGAEVLINGKLQDKPSPATYEGLYPGMVTVAARHGGRDSLVRKVTVELDAPAEVSIDIDYETSVAFDDKRFGFVFPDEATLQKRVADFASRIGTMLNVEFILVAGLVERDGRTFLDGHLIDVSKKSIERSNSFYTKANVVSNNRVREMAAFVGAKEYVPPPPSYEPWYTNFLGWGLLGTGLITAGVSLYFFSDFQTKADEFETEWPKGGPLDPSTPAPNDTIGCQTWMLSSTGSNAQYYDASCVALDNKRQRANQSSMIGTGLVIAGGVIAVGGILAFILWEREIEEEDAADAGLRTIELEYAMPSITLSGDASFQMGLRF